MDALMETSGTNGGWVKLYRSVVEKGWLTNHKLWVFWCYCLLKATHKETTAILGYQQVKLMPGQFVFGRRKASKETKLSEQEIRTAVATLKTNQNLTIKSTNKYSIISIVNWSTYQEAVSQNDHQINQQLTNNQPHTRSKEVKNKEYSPSFLRFYDTYPLGGGKYAAWETWQKLGIENGTFELIITAIEKQKGHKVALKAAGEFCPEWPLPKTWLRQRRWEDELHNITATEPLNPVEAYKRRQKDDQ